ncbi:MAG: SulP family inorganic anion transporter, partial [Gammaproteobacteria bacterium]|nr:SulP family inorganic anion transporter [Gammaproteobacteria bacterium]
MPTRYLPFLAWLPEFNRGSVRADALAGLTGAVVALPQGVAFATIAGMPPEYGLYAAMIPAVIAALFGSSRLLVSGPTTAASVVLFSTLSQFAEPGSAEYVSLALTLTLMVGVVQVILGIARFGAVVNFISHSVVVGFTAGAGVLIAVSQVKHFLGIQMPGGLNFYEVALHLGSNVHQVDIATTVVGLVTLLVGIVSRRAFPRVPYMLTALLVGSLVALLFNRFQVGPDVQVALTGAVPQRLPPLSAPDVSLETLKQLAPATLAVTLFALTEAVS